MRAAPVTWIGNILRELAHHDAVVRATVIRAEGSTPRETGAAMLVGVGHIVDTIGGGALELEAIAHARGLLRRLAATPMAPSWQRDARDFALGPSLGQCCGGHARLLFEAFTARERPALEELACAIHPEGALLVRPIACGGRLEIAASRKQPGAWPLAVTRVLREMLSGIWPRAPTLIKGAKGESAWFVEPLQRRMVPLHIYGAGHVGRALVRVLQDLPFAVTWADTAASRLPNPVPSHVHAHAAPDLPALAAAAPADAFHIVMTYSHALDLAICHAVLRRGQFAYLGLIDRKSVV